MKQVLCITPLVLLFCLSIACQDKAALAELEKYKAQAALEEQNKGVARQFYEAIDAQKFDRLKELLAPDSTIHGRPGEDAPASVAFDMIKMFYTAFPDYHHTIEDVIAEGDKVGIRILQQATHKADFQGIPASGNTIGYYQTSILRIVDGRIKDLWLLEDDLGLYTQLGMELKPKEPRK
jgi:predicted ester cyclase